MDRYGSAFVGARAGVGLCAPAGKALGEAKGGFDTLQNVASLFANPWVLLGGWVHYLAFDLFIGCWEVVDARERGLSHWMVVPCLLLTFLFGPAGLLLYFGIRLAMSPAPRTASSTSATS